jgi:His-Xaa-Ser system radical SAM maturase HxsB
MKFLGAESFSTQSYQLMPLRFRRLPWDPDRMLLSSVSGDWLMVPSDRLRDIVEGRLDTADPLRADLEARHLIVSDSKQATLAPMLSQIRTRKAYLEHGPALHIFVVSLRCHHTCAYCQVSRQPTKSTQFDMSGMAAEHAINRLFEWPSPVLTVEFQGGEPLLHFERVRALTLAITERNKTESRTIQFVIASTLHDVTDDQLAFFHDHSFQLSTSLDGPEWLHNANRPRPERDSYRRTLEGIERARRRMGDDSVSALTTLTHRSLAVPVEIVDEYRKLGFRSIFLRPLSPYGFALKTKARTGYAISDFLDFYRVALEHLLDVNRSGYPMQEVYASLLLSQLMTPFSHGYVDLRSPTGAGLGAIVYDYDGWAYPSDEARMLAAMGDYTFRLGRLDEPVSAWLNSDAMRRVLDAGVAEALPTCSDCVFVPWCGADPIDHYARQGDTVGHRPTSDFCRKQMGMFDLLLQTWETASAEDRATLEGWALPEASPTSSASSPASSRMRELEVVA